MIVTVAFDVAKNQHRGRHLFLWRDRLLQFLDRATTAGGGIKN